MSLKTQLVNVELSSPIYNASGCYCYTKDQLLELNNSDAGAVLTKTCTLNPRKGNEHPKYFETELGSINSNGLENSSYEYYKDLNTCITKPYILSVTTLEMDNALHILDDYNSFKPKALIEMNVSCPNIKNSPQVAYDFDKFEDSLRLIFERNISLNLGLKLSPYFDPFHITKVADIVTTYPVKFLTCINSYGNGLVVDTETLKPVIKPRRGLGGIGGSYCKPIALSNIYQFYSLLDDVQLIGCGGVETGQDVLEYVACGATAVQVGTHLIKTGTKCFTTINNELETLLTKKNVKNIMDLKGESFN